MKVRMKPTSVIIARCGFDPTGPVQSFFTNTCALHMDRYTPYDTGTMAKTVVENGVINERNVTYDKIIYNTDYAVYVYYPYRNGKMITYTTEHHKDAGPYWDKKMWNIEKYEVIKEVQDFVDRGGK